MSTTFKVSIPSGSLLEKELAGRGGRQRQQRLYFLAELGAEQIKRDNPPVVTTDKNAQTKQTLTGNPTDKVTFSESDLLTL